MAQVSFCGRRTAAAALRRDACSGFPCSAVCSPHYRLLPSLPAALSSLWSTRWPFPEPADSKTRVSLKKKNSAVAISIKEVWFIYEPHLGFQVGADPDHAPLDGHLEGEADDAADFQQRLLAQAPPGLRNTNDKTRAVISARPHQDPSHSRWPRGDTRESGILSSPGRPSRRSAAPRSSPACSWNRGRTEPYGGTRRLLRLVRPRRCSRSAGSRRFPKPVIWSRLGTCS